jgi:hypothetical protein
MDRNAKKATLMEKTDRMSRTPVQVTRPSSAREHLLCGAETPFTY